jgi:hypothetical protein
MKRNERFEVFTAVKSKSRYSELWRRIVLRWDTIISEEFPALIFTLKMEATLHAVTIQKT